MLSRERLSESVRYRYTTLERIGSDSQFGLEGITGELTFGPKPGAIDKG